jgi:hypothetical protein
VILVCESFGSYSVPLRQVILQELVENAAAVRRLVRRVVRVAREQEQLLNGKA